MILSQAKFRRAVFAILPFILLGAYFITIYIMMVPGHSIAPQIITYLQLLATILLLTSIVAIGWAYYAVIIRSPFSESMKNITLSSALILIMILCAECFFLHFAKSEGVGIQWSYKLWDKKFLNHRTYFHYINSKGENESASFREPVSATQKKKNPIWFIGDSFTFGFGLEQTDQTFPAQVERLLGGRSTCLNLGDGGADTYKEKENLFAFQRKEKQAPATIVWQYFGNDIDAKDEGPDLYEQELSKSRWIKFGKIFFCNKSFLLDFIYWHYFVDRKGNWVNTYSDFLDHMYHADRMFVDGIVLKDSAGYVSPYRRHLVPLKEAAAYYKSRGVNFLVIIFPFLWEGGPESSERLYANRLESELKADSTDVINLTPLFKDIPVEKRVVNPHDPHPSILIDRITADTIAKYLVSRYSL
jgi:hypothetical protein